MMPGFLILMGSSSRISDGLMTSFFFSRYTRMNAFDSRYAFIVSWPFAVWTGSYRITTELSLRFSWEQDEKTACVYAHTHVRASRRRSGRKERAR